MERAMQFILEQQARTDTKLETLTERVDTLTGKVDALTENVDALTENVGALATNHARDGEWLKRVEDTFLILTTMAQRHEERLDELGEAQSKATEQLASLASTVERYINERRNGQS